MTSDFKIKQYLDKGFISRNGKGLQWLGHSYQRYLAKQLISNLHPTQTILSENRTPFHISKYEGNNSCAIAIKKLLLSKNHPAIIAAVVHGSIAEGNEISYSDFDGILVIDTSVLQNADQLSSLRTLVKKTKTLFLEQDALQHHGWTILTTSDLSNYQDHVVPLHLLQTGKVLFPDESITLQATITSEKGEYENLLPSLHASIHRKCRNLKDFKNQYFVKNLLSELMLLPAAFLQAKKGSAVLKKESFELLKSEHPEMDTKLMEAVSLMRTQWTQEKINTKTRWYHSLKESGISLPFLAPRTPPKIYRQLDDAWVTRIHDFCNLLLNKHH